MKKSILLIIPVCIILFLVLFFTLNNKTENISTSSSEAVKIKLTAEDVIKKLQEKSNYIGTYVVYDENTDANNLLGRPNQYTSKVTFEDTRLEQINQNPDSEYSSEEEVVEPIGGTIEVFNNSEDMTKRKEYVNAISSSMSMFAEYSYANDYILLRLNKGLTPSQAQEYEMIFNELLN